MPRRVHALLWLVAVVVTAAARAQDGPVEVVDPLAAGLDALAVGDYAEAFCLWQPLARGGDPEAQYHIGWLYANGNGLAVDIDEALAWWMRAARQGHADSQFAVALAFTTGEGIGRDLDKAVDWYLMAARQGHEDARDILLQLNGDPEVALLQRHPEIVDAPWFGRAAEVRRDRVNARLGPGTGYAIVVQLDSGDRVRVIGRRDDWIMVVLDDGRTAWIYEALVSNL
jgi:SH3-like domain-containing protein